MQNSMEITNIFPPLSVQTVGVVATCKFSICYEIILVVLTIALARADTILSVVREITRLKMI